MQKTQVEYRDGKRIAKNPDELFSPKTTQANRDALRAKKIKTIVNLTATELQKAIRIESADENGDVKCVTCGKKRSYKDVDGGHFISRARTATVFTEENIHVQCKHCNGHLHGNAAEYRKFMEERYGPEFVNDLVQLSRLIVNYTKEELFALRYEFTRRWKKAEKELKERMDNS